MTSGTCPYGHSEMFKEHSGKISLNINDILW